ncbi:MAG: ATP-binding protein [Nanoarchaeota archaeon]
MNTYNVIKERVHETIKKYKLINKDDRVLLALSGGKDSSVLAFVLNDLKEKIGFELHLLHIDVGIEKNKYLTERVKKIAEKLKLPLHIVKAPISIDKVFEKSQKENKKANLCRICGIERRYYYIKFALENNFNVIATGHNLNDEAETFLMNILQNNWTAAISNYIKKEKQGFPRKIKPLYFVSNEETEKAARELDIIEKKEECPYSRKAFRYLVRGFLNNLKEKDPAILNKIINFQLKFYETINKDNINKEKELKKCKICGFPSQKEICKMCELKEKFKDS